jgi:hypothetical protein
MYKPIQSLFNKMYVHRGQVAMNLIGDLQRGTMYLNTPEELDRVKQSLSQAYQQNFDQKIDQMTNFEVMLGTIRACVPLKLRIAETGEVVDVIIYRIKDDSSQQERTDRGELSHLMNINFFIDGPQADGSRNATIIGACELQVGVMSTLHALRGGPVPYERQRILDGIPQLKHKLMEKPETVKEEEYDLTNRLFRAYHVVNTTGTVRLTHNDGGSNLGSYSGNFRPKMYCVNLGRINHWRKYNDNHKNMMQIWTCKVDSSTRYIIESLSVRVRNQDSGNTGCERLHDGDHVTRLAIKRAEPRIA